MKDQRLELVISYLLRAGVGISAALVLAGGAVYLAQHGTAVPDYQTFHGEPDVYRSLRGLLSLSVLRQGRGLIQLGLVVLIFTPIARVALSLFAFLAERDWMYVVVSAIVLATLLYSFLSA
jgi:uncharacterized membrane protein